MFSQQEYTNACLRADKAEFENKDLKDEINVLKKQLFEHQKSTMTTKQVADMVLTMLTSRLPYLTGRTEPLVADNVWCLERANNIAAALTSTIIS